MFLSFLMRFAHLSRFKFFTLTDHVKASCVAIQAHVIGRNLHVVVCVHSVGACEETKQAGLGVQLFNHVEETHDHVVATCGLTSGQHATNLTIKSIHR